MSPARIADRLQRNRPEVLVLVATLALAAFYYGLRADVIGVHRVGGEWAPMTAPAEAPVVHYVGSLLLLALIPVAAARGILGISLRTLGLGLGRWREGLVWLAVGAPIAILAGRIGADSAMLRAVYPLDGDLTPARFLPGAATQFLYYGSWEVLFRGVLLFGLRGSLGGGSANAIQTALSVIAHFGRAPDETFAAIPAGLLFGWIDLRIGSVWPVAILHWLVGVSMDWFIVS
jgi:membrane protease YdiL (CAAX protease family)